MNDDEEKGRPQLGNGQGDVRRQRLKLALRENLKRRKTQARGRDQFNVMPSNSDDVVADDATEKHPGK